MGARWMYFDFRQKNNPCNDRGLYRSKGKKKEPSPWVGAFSSRFGLGPVGLIPRLEFFKNLLRPGFSDTARDCFFLLSKYHTFKICQVLSENIPEPAVILMISCRLKKM